MPHLALSLSSVGSHLDSLQQHFSVFNLHYILLIGSSFLLLFFLSIALCADECEEEEDSEDPTLRTAGTSLGGGVSSRGSSGAIPLTSLTPLPAKQTSQAATSSILGTSPKVAFSGNGNRNFKRGGGVGGGGGKSSLPPKQVSKLLGKSAASAAPSDENSKSDDELGKMMATLMMNALKKVKVKGISQYKNKQKQMGGGKGGAAGPGCSKM